MDGWKVPTNWMFVSQDALINYSRHNWWIHGQYRPNDQGRYWPKSAEQQYSEWSIMQESYCQNVVTENNILYSLLAPIVMQSTVTEHPVLLLSKRPRAKVHKKDTSLNFYYWVWGIDNRGICCLFYAKRRRGMDIEDTIRCSPLTAKERGAGFRDTHY